jgi:Zn-dependent protease with chaperone function
MFANFLYFIIVLLIYATYQPSEKTNFSLHETLALLVLLLISFYLFTRFQFQRFEKKVTQRAASHHLDHHFNSLMTKQSVLAIVLFTFIIYGLNLPSFLVGMWLFAILPTLLALIFIILFVGLMIVIWSEANHCYRQIYSSALSRRTYIISNISFSIPVLLPWILLSGISDLIFALPFELPKQILSTTEGEVIYFLLLLILIATIGPAIIQRFWRCKPLEQGYLRSRIERLCTRARLKYSNIVYWPIFGGKMITAGVMGLIRKFRYILVTEALLKYLEPGEIDAVIAHEIGHVKKRHLIFYLIFFAGYMLISYATYDLVIYAMIYAEPLFRWISSSGLDQMTVSAFFLSLTVIIIFLLYFRFIFGFFMRNFERQADCYVYQLFESGVPLITTLEKIAFTSGQSPEKPNWHHFSIAERIHYLKLCEHDRNWISRHDRKIQKSIALFLSGMVFVGVVGYILNFSKAGRTWNSKIFITILQEEIQKSPKDPHLYSMLGDLYFSVENYAGVQQAYETSLSLDLNQPNVLNNLAWFYATCDDRHYRNTERALDLALKAAALDRSPHILDTLAESYFVNGMISESIETAQVALKKAVKDHDYFRNQLDKFSRVENKKVE